ncbi:MAG: TIGR03621 family F420-dependent LLM class oxidoreductase [Acidimicrobiales bacterium]
MRPFRFGLQIAQCSADDLRVQARTAEEAGFDVVHTWDHVADGWSPLAPLMAIADCTSTVRISPLVLNNDFHHPVHLAQELASLDHLSGGRLEVGIGAGHSFTEYQAIGRTFDPPAVRKARLAESVEILLRLLEGETVTYDGAHYSLRGVRTLRSRQDHVPLLVGVNGKRALAHAARHADIIGLTMLGRTLDDGQRHEVRWEAERLDATVDFIREQAGDRWEHLELNVLVQAVVITGDRRAAAEEQARRSRGHLSVADALATPFLALGTHDEIAEHLVACRDRWDVSYFSVRDLDNFAPVIQRLRGA